MSTRFALITLNSILKLKEYKMILEDLLKEMKRRDASDLYVTCGLPPIYRVEGVMSPCGSDNLDSQEILELADSMMNEEEENEFTEKREMNLALSYPGLGRFRINLFYQRNSVGFVVRQIRLDIRSIEELGLPPILKDVVMAKMGLVLIVGPTGSGKSTTLASMIEHRNTNTQGHIITIEEPIEFLFKHKQSIITQREIGIDTLSYADALKNAFRQAPDVILIGEIRDTETMNAALTFAETGHLCLGTLHANNANQAIERIINFFPHERHEQIHLLLSLYLKAIISQRLIPSLDGKRVASTEILLDTARVKDLILKREIHLLKDVMARGNQEGMMTFDQSIFTLYKDGKISYENALAYADSPNDLRLKIRTEGLEVVENEGKKPAFKLKN